MNIGRNEPCPCGSGTKFKKCCLNKPYKPSLELEADLALGQQRIAEYEAEQKARILRDKLIADGFSLTFKPDGYKSEHSRSYSPFEDSQGEHESFA